MLNGRQWPVLDGHGLGNGGERGIRTLGTLTRTTVFETAPFDHSGISPWKAQFNRQDSLVSVYVGICKAAQSNIKPPKVSCLINVAGLLFCFSMNTAVYLDGKADFWKEQVYYPFSGKMCFSLNFPGKTPLFSPYRKLLNSRSAPVGRRFI